METEAGDRNEDRARRTWFVDQLLADLGASLPWSSPRLSVTYFPQDSAVADGRAAMIARRKALATRLSAWRAPSEVTTVHVATLVVAIRGNSDEMTIRILFIAPNHMI